MKYLFSFFIVFLLVAGTDDDSFFLTSLMDRAEKYNRAFPEEHIYINTDRTFYKPGDELWFKAFVINSLGSYNLSKDLNIKLIDVFGSEVLNLRFPLLNNESKGYMVIPSYFEEGKYYLIGYTGWMKNLPANEAFRKEIIISSHVERSLNLDLIFTKELYYPGNLVEGEMNVIFPDGTPVNAAKYTFSCKSNKKIVFRGRGSSDEDGNAVINFELPKEIDSDFLLMEITVKHKKKTETFIESFPIARKNIEIRFFPEGGKIIEGIENIIAFKAVDSYGLPVEIAGILIDESGQQIEKIQSTCMGMGKFTLNPMLKQYKVHIFKPMIENNIFDLPEISSMGIQLNYSGLKDDDIQFSIRNADSNQVIKVNVALEENGSIGWLAAVEFKRDKLLKVPVKNFKTGVISCTVFDDEGNTYASRSFAIDRKDSENGLIFTASKTLYGKRDKVYLDINNLNTGNTTASIAVYNSRYVDDSGIDMPTYLNYFVWLKDINPVYFEKELNNENLDLVMLTHKSKSLPIAGLCRNDFQNSLPYYNQDGIIGQVLDKKGNPEENARIKIIHTSDLRTFQTTTDAKGMFNVKFDNKIINYNFLNIAIADEFGKSGNNLMIYDNYSDNILRSFTLDKVHWNFNQFTDLLKYKNPLLLFSGRYNQGRKKEKSEFSGKGYDYNKYSTYLNVADILREIKSCEIVENEIVFTGHRNSLLYQKGAIIVIDGISMGTNASVLNTLSPKEIRNISISTLPVDIHRYTGLNSMGLIEITTLRGGDTGTDVKSSDIQQDFLMVDHEYSGPDYSVGDLPEYDVRTTLFWKANIVADGSSSAKIMFYTSDIPGTYKCQIFGTDTIGNLFEKQISFTVR